ncbi:MULTISPECIES: metallophosphoesterase [unclassified Pseudodesulfovibrio]|uniref:metallophosphoesterase family protein n=1 Tax=unclassified Pseudodesulfovibrio TaxID=2661612 RepID=UPI0019D42C65|nr:MULTISPECIES: metallophosphoesterase [unclassified Pseudodesulfovibrio]MCJ2165211.1 metallophosphoesterase [Pseudodesulfovibrio sp. S3-i]
MMLDRIRGKGLFMVADPHLADHPPGQRLVGYLEQIMSKLAACLDRAEALGMVPVILGDLFHWPRDNSNKMLVDLIRLFAARTGDGAVWILVGNHDKYQSRFTDDVSLAVLETAGVVRLMKEGGPQFVLETGQGPVMVCASPDGTPLPKGYDREEGDPETVIWLTHHNIQFPEFIERAYSIKELPGIDWLVNGHIHRPQPTVVKGQTVWANPGNITRLTFSRRSMEREPAAAIWTPGCSELERWVVPFLPFDQVFPDQELPPEEQEIEGESNFIKGLERLAWQRTHEGTGLKQFLEENLSNKTPEGKLIWELYEEVIHGE